MYKKDKASEPFEHGTIWLWYTNQTFKIWTSLVFGWSLYLTRQTGTLTLNPKFKYSKHPNTEPRAVFELHLMPVPSIRISDHLKSGLCVRFASLDRFITKRVMNKIFSFYDPFINKTVLASGSFENRTNWSSIQMFRFSDARF
jgi:hypothetical protein